MLFAFAGDHTFEAELDKIGTLSSIGSLYKLTRIIFRRVGLRRRGVAQPFSSRLLSLGGNGSLSDRSTKFRSYFGVMTCTGSGAT